MKIAIAQINSKVGDFDGNAKKIRQALGKAADADLVLFPEAAICGYPQQDLLDYPSFAARAEETAASIIRTEGRSSFLLGSVEANRQGGKPYRNVALFADKGKLVGKYFKRLLPTYDVFDEDRFFEPGREPFIFDFAGEKIAVTICEDIWSEVGPNHFKLENRYHQTPLADCKEATVIANLSASPFEYAKVQTKRLMLEAIAKKYNSIFAYANCVGANDGIIFDGRSYVWGPEGQLLVEGKAYQEDLVFFDTKDKASLGTPSVTPDDIKEIYEALMLGIRDYCAKQKFSSVILGLSGGIDSAVVSCLASDALGPENVVVVMMPSRYTSSASNEDALAMAKAMQNPLHILIIEDIFQASLRTLGKAFEGLPENVAEENLQSRARGMILMGLSNKLNHLLLSCSNKSEMAVGYATLYGDTCGGLAPISDVYKHQVYALGREANRRSQRIPERIFTRAPSAELRPNQSDQDSLPAYEKLDAILKLILEEFKSPQEIIKEGFAAEEVAKIFNLLNASEYKRYQSPLGLKVSAKAFGLGRRIPLVHDFFRAL